MDNNQNLTYGIYKCDKDKCVTCKSRLCFDNHVVNHVTGERFDITFNGSCNTRNCIYVIKCKHDNCQYQYTGHTINHISSRISQHKSSILKGAGSKILRDHFTNVHSINDMEIMPIDLLPNKTTLKQREEQEESWMLKLNTVFPYGLNARCKKAKIDDAERIIVSSKDIIYTKFNVVKINRRQRGGVKSPLIYSHFDPDSFVTSVLKQDLLGFRNIRTEICKLKKKHLKSLYIKVIGLINDGFQNTFDRHMCFLIKDLTWFYLKRMGTTTKKKNSGSFLVVQYCNKFVEYVNLSKIFKHKNVNNTFPHKSQYFSIPTVSYKYGATIRSKVVNYHQTHLDNLDHTKMTCDCSPNNNFVDGHHGHVVTGDLNIIDNVELRNLLSKGLNYRDQIKPSIPNAIKAIESGLTDYIIKMSDKLNKPVVAFNEWKFEVLEHVKVSLKSKKIFSYNSVLSKGIVKQELEKLHHKYVLVPTDKASNNVTIVCKKFYVSLINKEIMSTNFQRVNKSPEEVINVHKKFLASVGIEMEQDNKELPYIYCTPKQHKSPIGFRYITAGFNSSLQQLSVLVGICLKSMLHSAKNYSKYKNHYHHRNDFYVIDGHEEVLEFLHTNNTSHKGPKNISTFDFSTLYTSIPHDQLKNNLHKFIDRIFTFKEKLFITPNTYTKRAYFSCNAKGKVISFSKDSLILCLDYLIDNAYVIYNGHVYRQVIGIPMGTNAAPHMANIYLHSYEYDYIQNLIDKGDEVSLKKLCNIFRFQDDLLAINDSDLLGNILYDIYPREMAINKTNISPCKCSYLDLSISIYRGKFRIMLFDKRTSFPFNVISYPYLDGNIPESRSYGIFISQLVRFCSVNSTLNGFINDVSNLVMKLCKQGFILAALRIKFLKFYNSKINLWGKYGKDIYTDMMKLFSD